MKDGFMIEIVGGPVLIVGYLAVMFGLVGQHGALAGLSALLVALFEFSLGVWLIVKGFNPTAANELLNAVLDMKDGFREHLQPSLNPSTPLKLYMATHL